MHPLYGAVVGMDVCFTLFVLFSFMSGATLSCAPDPAEATGTMANGDLVFHVRLWVKPERVEEWKQAVREIVGHMAKEPAFVACYLHQDAQDTNAFTLYERWREPSVEAFLANQAKPYRAAYEARLPDLLQRPREPTVLLPLDEWHAARD